MKSRFRSASLFAAVLLVSSSAFAAPTKITGTPNNRLADAVLKRLLSTPLGQAGPRLHYQVILLDDFHPNAMTNTRGKVYITKGLFRLLDDDRGVWAAVIGHELGHNFLQHPGCLPRFGKLVRAAYQKARTQGYTLGPARLPALHLGEGISVVTRDREVEVQADLIGMMLMAEAGYQPGFAVLLDQRLRHAVGGGMGPFTIFSRHPRLETREQHSLHYYDEATDIFRSDWPDAAKSPGGNLPPYGSIGRWTFSTAKGGQLLVFDVSFEVHNARGARVRVAAGFMRNGRLVTTHNPAYRMANGMMLTNVLLPGAASESKQVRLSVPRSALAASGQKFLAVVYLTAGGRYLDVASREITLPK